jgi:hypothetical protein
VSAPFNAIQQSINIARESLTSLSAAATTASETDKAGTWGVDGWIRVFHDLIDLQVRAFANVLQTGVSGPWWLQTSDELTPPDPVVVPTAAPYPRAVTVSDFARVGYPDVKIPSAGLSFEPVLPANAERFMITLRDERFIGSNYKGTVTLTNTATGAAEVPFEVTLGL